MNKKIKKLVLIDGNAIIHRAYHALPPLTTKKGELVNAVYGFSSILLKVIADINPDYILASFDLAGPTFRHDECADYKATRVKGPDELYGQIERVKELTRAFNIPIFEEAGFEADDVIGTLAKQANEEENLETIIVTGDLDTLQLVNEKTKIYALRRGMSDVVIYDEAKVMERYQIKPDQVIDFKGLKGDPSDNIPGVKGVGEKTAIDLVKKYGDIENIYKNIGEIKGALKDKLERDKMQAIMSKRLATIVTNVPLKLDLNVAVTHEFDRKKIVALFQELNFFSMIKRIPQSIEDILKGEKINMNDQEGAKTSEVKDFKFELVSKEKLDAFIEKIKSAEEISLWVRKTPGKYFESEIRGVAIGYKTGRAGYVEYDQENFSKLKTVLEQEKIKKIGYDLKLEMEILQRHGIDLKNIYWDVMISAYVINPGSKTELANIVLEELGEEMENNNKKGQLGLEIESLSDIAQKICQKADYLFKLKSIHEKKIQEISQEQKNNLTENFQDRNLENVFHNLEMPLAEILAEIEMNGIRLNTSIFLEISEKINKRILNLEKSIHELAGSDFNINSPRQVGEVLFEKLKISTFNVKKLKTGYSTASSELIKLRGEHKIIEKIEEYREIFKLKTTYLDVLPILVQDDSRIHANFNQAVTATGRLSSSDPNLQNIPIRTDLGQLLRVAFEAESGYRLVAADYSQIDLRVVAHMSGDKNMIEAFTKGEDIHRATASIVNKISISQVSEKMRSKAKALNFGIIYGMSVFGFSVSAGIDRDEAKKFIDEYMKKFSGVANYMQKTKEFARKNLYVETEIGRRRQISEINSPNFQVQNAAERMAINMPIQGLSADIVKLAMLESQELIKKYSPEDVRMVLQVHDELIFEVKENLASDFAKKIKTAMEEAYKLKVPLVVDVKIGNNWGEV
ncbi:MAG TPA: DNA polymerase I [Candidatus Moranbacteria bacterium]|nr:DNA polymerase I [Candidatus Moranbacteria bacterium]